MRTYLKHILLFLALGFIIASCQKDLEPSKLKIESETLTLVPRVKSFTNQYVTKAAYSENEKIISTLSVLIFNKDGNILDIQESVGASVTINKSILNTATQAEKLDEATVVMFANISLNDIKDAAGNSIKEIEKFGDLANYSYHFAPDNTVITDLGDGFNGFPMVGTAEVDLRPTAQQDELVVNLKILYAKINFRIEVAEGGENQSLIENGPSFNLTGYTVNNVATVASFNDPEEGAATADANYAYTTESFARTATGNVTSSSSAATFTFYVAESRYNPKADLTDIYPSDEWLDPAQNENEDVKNYSSLSEEQKALAENKLNGFKYVYDNLFQQYKPKLATAEAGSPATGLATYVTVNGTYKDYRGTDWTVNYKIYLGKDNAHNFHVDRNSEYTNILTIKGIRNNNSYGEDNVWIDHRVNVSTDNLSSNVKITRETLIDSHIEVRPLRVGWVDNENDEKDGYVGVRLYLPQHSDGTLVNWIGIERFTGNNCLESTTYCYDKTGKSTGKRRYFTTSLISELQSKEGEYGVQDDGARKYITLLNGECAWIYFDENVALPAQQREAEIILEFYPADENKSVETVKYKVKQKGLQQSIGGYSYESYEEYLHSYDSYDTYNLSTSPVDYTQQGLKWGHEGTPLSSDIIVSKNTLILADISQGLYSNRYDFLVQGDSYNAWHMYRSGGLLWDDIDYTGQSGKYFTDRITEKKKLSVKDMGTMPENAHQYCLSKNKFTADDEGNVTMKINWYLPDAHEMQDILSSPSNALHSDVYYWSSQPSFNEVQGRTSTFLNENPDSARVVSNFVELPIDLPREQQHRIRCLYSPDGIVADMEGRTPDGIGGIRSFVMKAYLDKNKSGSGYFNYLIADLTAVDKTTTEKAYKDTSYVYPTRSNSHPTKVEFEYKVTTDKAGNNFEGFVVDPDEKNNWDDLTILNNLFGYYTLARYDGLSANIIKTLAEDSDMLKIIDGIISRLPENLRPNIDFDRVANETTIPKSDTLVEVIAPTVQYDRDLASNPNLESLLPQEEGGLSISFSQHEGEQHPIYSFLEYRDGTRTTYIRNWIAPRYEPDTREMNGDTRMVNIGGKGEASASLATSSNVAKQHAFNGNSLYNWGDGAYEKAIDNALANLDILLESDEYEGWNKGAVTYTPLTYTSEEYVTIDGVRVKAVDYNVTTNGNWIKTYNATCVVNLIATIELTKPGSETLYVQAAGTGQWSGDKEKPIDEKPVSSVVETDQLKMFSGNSFTISVSNPNYEITQVKVHYSENNFITDFGTGDKAYARFINSTINLPTSEQPEGMDYQDDETGGIHKWSGVGKSQVTLILADYLDMTNLGNILNLKTFRYEKASKNLSKYIIIDKIEVKCTKKPTAQP